MEQEKIRVLMIGPARSVHGGISGVVNNYYGAGLDELVDLCYIGTMVEGSKIRKLWQAAKAYVRFLVRLPRCDIVHVNMASDASYYRKSVFIRTAFLFGRKIVIHQHGGNFPAFYERELDDRGRARVRKVLAMCDALLVLGTAWRDFFGRISDPDKIKILSNAVPIPQSADRRYGVHKILYLGRICKDKGIDELLDAMAALRGECPGVRLYLGGIWEDASLRKRAAALDGPVSDLGWLDSEAKNRRLDECDIFVLPSYYEGQPVSVLEAMAHGCGIVVTRTGSVPDLIRDGENGLLIEPKNTEALHDALLALLTDDGLCRRLGESARQTAEASFSIEDHIHKLLSVYAEVLGAEMHHGR